MTSFCHLQLKVSKWLVHWRFGLGRAFAGAPLKETLNLHKSPASRLGVAAGHVTLDENNY